MHPALSVIFFTVISGAGFGFIFFIGLGWPLASGGLNGFLTALIAGGLAVAGLVSSTFHLGHPERAIKAFSQWRSSWLSREGVLAVATLVLFGIYTLLWTFYDTRNPIFGLIISALCVLTVFATAMIYAQLKTVPHWKTVWTPVCYLAFAFCTGLMFAILFSSTKVLFGVPVGVFSITALVLAWCLKLVWWKRADTIGFSQTNSSTATATGLGHLGKVSLFERPHTGENYLTHEMVHKIGRKHARKLRLIALVSGAVIPVLFNLVGFLGVIPSMWMALAIVSFIIGLFVERWLFFAQAKHAVSLYY